MTKKEKRAWDRGFEACDSGVKRDHFPRSMSSAEILAWLAGWDVSYITGRPDEKEKRSS